MSATGEATINPDGTTTTTTTTNDDHHEQQQQYAEQQSQSHQQEQSQQDSFQEEIPNDNTQTVKRAGTDPAIYLALSFITFVILYVLHYKRQKKKQMDRESFFIDMDGDKFNIQLPKAVDEYYEVKEKCVQAGWEPGKAVSLFFVDMFSVSVVCLRFLNFCLFLMIVNFVTWNIMSTNSSPLSYFQTCIEFTRTIHKQ